MLLTIMFVWLTVTDAPVRLDPPVFAERQRLQKSARSRPLYSLWKHVTTESVEEAAATERTKHLQDFYRLRVIARYGQALPVVHHLDILQWADHSDELRLLIVVLIESRYDWRGEKLPHDWQYARDRFLEDGTNVFRGWDCMPGITAEWEFTCDQYSLEIGRKPVPQWNWSYFFRGVF